jgi:hypothetical protein
MSVVLEIEPVEETVEVVDTAPMSPAHPKWEEYVLSQFEDGELTTDGKPRLHGLRRLVRKCLGDIIRQDIQIINPSDKYAAAIFSCTIQVGETPQTYSDAADVHNDNVDIFVAPYKVAVAASRAEARVYRKALGISVVAAEELNKKDSVQLAEQDGTIGNVKPSQISFLNNMCRKLDIDGMKFINSGKSKPKGGYTSVEQVPQTIFFKMQTVLNSFQQDTEIPESLKGYQTGWTASLDS